MKFALKGFPLVIVELDFPHRFPPDIWNEKSLLHLCDERPCTVRRGHTYGSMESVEMTFSEYKRSLEVQASTVKGGLQFYGANNMLPPDLIPWLPLPPYFPAHTKRLTDTALWFGPPGTGAPLHRDLQVETGKLGGGCWGRCFIFTSAQPTLLNFDS